MCANYGRWMRDEAKKSIGHLYPEVDLPDGSQATVMAWLWARTVASPNPAARGAHVPLVSSFMLSNKEGKQAWVEPVLAPAVRDGYRFEIRSGKADPRTLEKVKKGTKSSRGSNFVCVLTGTPITPAHIKAEGKAKRMGARLMAIVAEGKRGRIYLPPDEEHERIAASAKPAWAPEGDMPKNPRWFSPPDYGMPAFADLFTPRELVALTTFSDLVLEARAKALEDARAAGMDPDPTPLADGGTGAQAYADAIIVYLAFAVDKASTRNCSLTIWEPGMGRLAGAMGRQALPMQWAYAETNPLAGAGGDIAGTAISVAEVIVRNRRAGVSPEMAVRLAAAFGGTPQVWINLQAAYEYAQVSRRAEAIRATVRPVYPVSDRASG